MFAHMSASGRESKSVRERESNVILCAREKSTEAEALRAPE